MSGLFRSRAGILLTLIVAGGLGHPAHGCGCEGSDRPVNEQIHNAYAEATAVFIGRVARVQIARTSRTAWFAVRSPLKGPRDSEIVISTDEGECGFVFQAGEDYLVYAYTRDGVLRTNSCTRTRLLRDAMEDITVMAEFRDSYPAPSDPTGPSVSELLKKFREQKEVEQQQRGSAATRRGRRPRLIRRGQRNRRATIDEAHFPCGRLSGWQALRACCQIP